MKCTACHNENEMVTKKGEIDLRIGGKLYLVRNVSYEECPACGEQVISPISSPEVSQDLFERLDSNHAVY